MKLTHYLVGALAIAACHPAPAEDTLLGAQLGESTKSPGSNPSKPAPLTPDDPRVMNMSAGITRAQARQTARASSPGAPASTSAAPTSAPTPAPTSGPTSAPTSAPTPAPRREQSPPNPATSSTPVQPPTDIAPRSTETDTNRPGVFSPPPPPPE